MLLLIEFLLFVGGKQTCFFWRNYGFSPHTILKDDFHVVLQRVGMNDGAEGPHQHFYHENSVGFVKLFHRRSSDLSEALTLEVQFTESYSACSLRTINYALSFLMPQLDLAPNSLL